MTAPPISRQILRTSVPRIMLSLPIGAFSAGFGFSFAKLVIYRAGWGGQFWMEGGGWNGTIDAMVIDGSVLSIAYLLALTLASPIWPVLERTFFRRWWGAGVLGAGLTGLIWTGLITAHHNRGPSYQAPLSFDLIVAVMIVANGLAGVVIWCVAYRNGRAGTESTVSVTSAFGQNDNVSSRPFADSRAASACLRGLKPRQRQAIVRRGDEASPRQIHRRHRDPP
jgi:hypothetical protein